MSGNNSSNCGSSSSGNNKRANSPNEILPLLVPQRSYGSLLPYYEFVKNAAFRTQTLPRSDSMVSLCFRSLATFINDNNFEGFQSFLDSKQAQVDDRDENGCTALILASIKGRSNFVRELLAYGADANAEDCDNWTALLCAAKEGHADICLQLLEHNAEIEHRDMGGWTALMWATYKGRTDVVNLLLDRRADVNAHGNYHISSLLWAAGRGHTDIVETLIANGAKVNMGDKYGTTALIWACRKGYTDIVRILLKAGANVDTAGMYSWTALLVATQGNHEEIVHMLLEHKPNVNALDKDGCSALTIACKDGYYEIATALMNVGAYINIQDRSGDTNLIHAVKGGHRAVVEALLKKYADVDITGKDRKTAIYMAVEKSYVAIVKVLLNSNPDLEIATKDGDTPLLKAVRSRNAEIVQLLLDKKSKVTAADKKGDTALHIAMRARSKAIVEILLRNPKHSHLLYRPNRAGETPYNIDMSHPKTILGQIFGARRLNTNEDNENMLGYDLYSSALADILSEPCLSMPITVGLYAKWGSGKSFLLNKLRDEMKNFARQWVDPVFQFTLLLLVLVVHAAFIFGTVVGLSINNWIVGIVAGSAIIVLCYLFLALVWYAGKRYDWDWPYNFHVKLTRKLNNMKLILQMLFCHPPGMSLDHVASVQPIRFYFTDQTKVSSTTGGENSVVQMIGSLYDAIENDYGSVSTRLYRAFKPKPIKSSTWKWRKICCLPTIVIFEITLIFLLIGTCALTVFLIRFNSGGLQDTNDIEKLTLYIILITAATLLGIATLANLYTWSKMFRALFRSQRSHLQKTIAKMDTLKSEGFIQALKQEVNLMKDMVKCLDSLSSQQTRLVIIVDGLDSCEQDKVLLVLDAVHMLFSDANSPFIVILAIDPHVIAKAAEFSSSRRLFNESNIGGHSYLNNMVHLPFYLQNSGLRKVKVAQQTALQHRKNHSSTTNEESGLGLTGRTLSARRLSSENALMSSTEKLKVRKGSRKLKLSESVASSIGSNLNKIGGAQDLTKMLLTDDYFSDVNPRSMRRLMNVVYITGRLLKAFQVDFNWYRLASWINITEQWPFRTSWIIYQYDICEDGLDDNTSLKALYDQVRPYIPTSKETEPLLELDRDEKKFDIFLTFHRSSLLVSDLKVFLPFTINLDPYLKKVIKEETQTFEDGGLIIPSVRTMNLPSGTTTSWSNAPIEWNNHRLGPVNRRGRTIPTNGPTAVVYPQTNVMNWRTWSEQMQSLTPQTQPHYPLAPVTNLPDEILELKLSTLSVDGVCKLLEKIEDVNVQSVQDYVNIIKMNNINGKVLLHCDLDELKRLLKMSFGDWEMFKVAVVSLREQELTTLFKQNDGKSLRFSKSSSQIMKKPERKLSITKSNVGTEEKATEKSKPSVMEKQVTLEDIMICGALQTLNEEACEDVLEEQDDGPECDNNTDLPITFIVPPSPDQSSQQEIIQQQHESRSRTNSSNAMGETDFVILQSSPIGHMHWQPVGISVKGNTESISEHSSRCSSPTPSPSLERRRSNSIRLSNLKSGTDVDSAPKKKHVIINTDNKQTNRTTTSETKFITKRSQQDVKNSSSQTPTSAPTTATSTSKRPVSLYLKHDVKGNKYSTRIRSHSIDNTSSNLRERKKSPSLEKLHKLREKFFFQSSNDIKENPTDDESTPLVSELSSPLTISPDDRSSRSLTSSDPLSPYVNRTISLAVTDRPTTSANNYLDNPNASTFVKQVSTSSSSQRDDNNSLTRAYNLSSSSLDITLSRPRTMSECTDSSLSLLGSNFKLINTSNASLHSRGSQSSCHLSRQDALEWDEYLTDVYCDPTNKN